jgi:hypothetical protein
MAAGRAGRIRGRQGACTAHGNAGARRAARFAGNWFLVRSPAFRHLVKAPALLGGYRAFACDVRQRPEPVVGLALEVAQNERKGLPPALGQFPEGFVRVGDFA